jgi:putative Mn2+ efflux pump MntP
MDLITIFLLAVALGVDAFSVAIGISAASDYGKSWQPVLRLASFFGVFQFAMPIIGWLAGLTIVNIIAGYDHWVAFALLTYVGCKLIWEALKKEEEKETNDQTKGLPLLLLSIATSIDALAVGFSFSVLKEQILFPAVIIGIVCFFMTVTGMLFGKGLARIFGKKVGIFGGVVLIKIGVKIIVDHL